MLNHVTKGICYAFHLKDYSLAKAWGPYAKKVISNQRSKDSQLVCTIKPLP